MDDEHIDVNKKSACSSTENQPLPTEKRQKFVETSRFTTNNGVSYNEKDNVFDRSSKGADASCSYDYLAVQECFTQSNEKSTFNKISFSSVTDSQPLFTEIPQESCEALQSTTKCNVPYYKEKNCNKTSTFICEYCSKNFTNKTIYKAHIRSHTGEKPFGCQYCTKRFGMKEHLKLHTRVHTGERPFQCEYCGKSFVNTSNLKVHISTHVGGRPYKCRICGMDYRTKKNLDRHRKAKHPENK